LAIGFRDGKHEGSLSDYKRIPRVVCKTRRREEEDCERERDSLKRKGQKLGTFPKKEGTNPKTFCCVTMLELLCCFGGCTTRIRTVCTTEERGNF
jgi:hypothetical protein